MPQKYNLKMENRRINITDIDFAKGDKLIVNGIEQLVIDIHGGSVFTEFDGKEIEYFMILDGDKIYLGLGE